MNHTPVRTNARSIEMTDDGDHVQVCNEDSQLRQGNEWFHCGLSNEILLRGYGFCLEENPADAVSVKICTT